jgi:hypothetical protein
MSELLGRDADYNIDAPDDSFKDLLVAGIFIILINIVVIWVHKSNAKKSNNSEIQDEVNSAVAQYFALRGDEAQNTTGEVEM